MPSYFFSRLIVLSGTTNQSGVIIVLGLAWILIVLGFSLMTELGIWIHLSALINWLSNNSRPHLWTMCMTVNWAHSHVQAKLDICQSGRDRTSTQISRGTQLQTRWPTWAPPHWKSILKRASPHFQAVPGSTKLKFLFHLLYCLFGVHTDEAIEVREPENGKKNTFF